MLHPKVVGDLAGIIGNEDDLYEGNLVPYFRVIFFEAKNLDNPYHNFRHMLHVLWLCHNACRYYQNELTARQMRVLLIAALFHDFDHPGHPHPGEEDPDSINIGLAITGVRRHITPADRALLPEIEALIATTHYPHKIQGGKLDLPGQIICDADLAQAFSLAWIQQVVIGLAREWCIKPLDVLRAQVSFLTALPFSTEWARRKFPQKLVAAKIEEARKLLLLLEPAPAAAAPASRQAGNADHDFRYQRNNTRAKAPPHKFLVPETGLSRMSRRSCDSQGKRYRLSGYRPCPASAGYETEGAG